MNKKIIKYLICIILIALALILMPTKKTMAATEVTYDTFSKSQNLFCLNKGKPFRGTEKFTVSTISDGEFTFPESNNKTVETVILKYIISESDTGAYGERTTVADYTPQKAIWKLAGSSVDSTEAEALLAKAHAYNSFVSDNRPKEPRIQKEGTNKVAIYYYEAESSTNYGTGYYTSLLFNSINVDGATRDSGNPQQGTYSGGYNRKITYTKNQGVTEVTVNLNYETSRWANLELYESTEKIETVTYLSSLVNNTYEHEFMIVDGDYYHVNCSSAQDNICNQQRIGSFLIPEWRCTVDDTKLILDEDGWAIKASENLLYKLYENETTDITKPQNLLYGDGGINTSDKSRTITFGLDITINKTDSLTGAKLSGAKFKVELTNVSSIDGYAGGTSTVYVTTNSNGKINLTGILPTNYNSAITVKITEVEAPTATGWYYKDLTSYETQLIYNSSSGKWKRGSTTLSDNTLTVNLTNTPYIDLRGNVWQDAQTGDKNVSGPNGIKDNGEAKLQGVIVQLYSVKDSKVISTTTTDSNGNYAFNGKQRTTQGFIIIFKYNGITYVETPQGTVSKASEINRTAFNNRFKTIGAGQSNDGTALGYTYNNSNKTSTLNSTIAGHTTGTTDAKFQMSAQTSAYNTTSYDIDCGLVKKNFDLAIGTDVKSATLKINEKTTEYTYAQIMDGVLDFQNSSSSKEDVVYNLYLYSSDFNYRIDDYKTDIENVVNPGKPEGGYIETEGDANTDRIKELEAYVTYSVILKSQTTEAVTATSTVEQFVYYYDNSVYSPVFSVNDIVDGYKVVAMQGNKITFENADASSNALKDRDGDKDDYRKEVNLTFKVKENGDQIVTIRDNVTNIAEITIYSTSEGGLIDKDSAPANGITNGAITKYEDDTDTAKGLNIVLRNEETRTITGTVFADTDKDGKLNNENTAVSDVIVQLIEIKKINGQYYEYIWQETRSGSNEVKTTARNGYTGTTYTNSVTETGKYEFKDFIPGNYIIRYIYGDGTTYDVTDNVKKYNGQDYKSTKDPNYNKPWYNTAGYAAGDSIARDNEARRLEVMAYSTTIDRTNGADLANKTDEALQNTWMCAETSRINIPVDADNKATDTNSTTASYDYTNKNTKVLFGDMNFGLALRPETNIVLEKHITALKITPSGTGVQSIVDAKAEGIESILNGTEVKVEGVTDGLATIKSTALERGFWQVATDVEELMQGAELEVEYTYVIRNDSEENYLSNTLVEAYENQDIKPYNEVLAEVNNTVKGTMRSGTYSYSNNNTIGTYLGEFYYTGNKGANDELVSARVERFEEALNNDLAFDETEGTSFKIARQASKENVYGVDKEEGTKETEINTVVENVAVSTYLTPRLEENHTTETADWSKTITLRTTLATVDGGELGANLPSYIAEVLQYSNAAGRKDMTATPENLSYVNSDDSSMTIASDNEQDEFWGETIIITKPTGEDKLSPLQIVLITISAIAILGVGIVLIKKYVLKNNA